MAVRACTLEAPFPLCHMPDAILGVSQQHENEDHVIVTVQSTAVHIYNVPDQKCVTSWAVSPSTVLTHHAVQHPVSKLYYTVDNHKLLRSWHDGVDKLESGPAKNYRHRIHAVHVHEHLDGAVLLFADGTAVQADAKLVNTRPICPAPQNIASGTAPIFSTVATTGKGKDLYMVVLLESAAGPTQYIVQMYEIDTQTAALATKLRVQHTLESAAPLVCATYESQSRTLCTLSTRGTLSVFQLPALDTSDNARLNPALVRNLTMYMPCEAPKKGPGASKSSTGTSRLAMYAFDKAYVAIVGEAPDTKFMVSVWDTKFGTLQGQREMRVAEPQLRQAARHSNMYQIMRSASLGQGAFICTLGRHVDVCPVYCTEFTLAAAMSCMRSTAAVLSADDAARLLVPPMVAPPQTVNERDVSAWRTRIGESGVRERKLLQVVSDTKAAPTATALKKAVDAYLADVNKEAGSGKGVVAPQVVDAVVRRCTQTDNGVWLEDVVLAMLCTGCVSVRACPDLVSQCLAKNALGVLESILLRVQDLPERDLVRIAQHVLAEANRPAIVEYFANSVCGGLSEANKAKRIAERDAGVDHLLALVFSAPRNDVFMLAALKSFGLDDVMTVLQLLRTWFLRYMSTGDKRLKKHYAPTRIPSFKQVIEWIGLVLDAHMARLLLVADSRQMLVELKDVVQRQTQLCEAMQDLYAYVHVLDSHASLPAVNNQSLYSVEVIHL